jgi:hypothetical protein
MINLFAIILVFFSTFDTGINQWYSVPRNNVLIGIVELPAGESTIQINSVKQIGGVSTNGKMISTNAKMTCEFFDKSATVMVAGLPTMPLLARQQDVYQCNIKIKQTLPSTSLLVHIFNQEKAQVKYNIQVKQ